jgi:hypothetical protein
MGIIVSYTSKQMTAEEVYHIGRFWDVICAEVIYHPIVRDSYVHKSQVRVFDGHQCDALHRRVEAIKGNPEWPMEIKNLIFDGKVRLEMTSDQVRASWGEPNDINRSVGSWGVREQWVYRNRYYLHFENDILKSWSEF